MTHEAFLRTASKLPRHCRAAPLLFACALSLAAQVAWAAPPATAEPEPTPASAADETSEPAPETRDVDPEIAIAPPAIVATRLKQLDALAVEMAKYGDWRSAAAVYEEALRLAPSDTLLEFKIGDAATRAKDCNHALLYFHRFIKHADPNKYPNEIQAAKKAAGELETFDCPARTAADEAAAAKTRVLRAAKLGSEGDWGGAAVQYYEAYQIDPSDPLLTYEIALASWKDHACSEAVDYFDHFVASADPGKHRKQITEANKYLAQAEAGECKARTDSERDTHARELYSQGQNRELSLDFVAAAGKYERAYALVKDNHALAFRAAEAYWAAQQCREAEAHYRTFVSKGDELRLVDDMGKAERILARIEAHGCPEALWNTDGGSSGASKSNSQPARGVDREAPPRGSSHGGGAAHCAVVDDGAPARGLGLSVLLLVGAIARRRRR